MAATACIRFRHVVMGEISGTQNPRSSETLQNGESFLQCSRNKSASVTVEPSQWGALHNPLENPLKSSPTRLHEIVCGHYTTGRVYRYCTVSHKFWARTVQLSRRTGEALYN